MRISISTQSYRPTGALANSATPHAPSPATSTVIRKDMPTMHGISAAPRVFSKKYCISGGEITYFVERCKVANKPDEEKN